MYNRHSEFLTAENRKEKFAEAKHALKMYLKQNEVSAEIYLTDDPPEANPISGKYKHIIAKREMQSQIH